MGLESEPSARQSLQVKRGLFLEKGGPFVFVTQDAYYDTPWCLLNSPSKAKDKWATNAFLAGGGKLLGSMQVIGKKRLKVPAGEYLATQVDWNYSIDPGPKKCTISYWYAEGVGLIQVGDPPTVVLKSFIPRKD